MQQITTNLVAKRTHIYYLTVCMGQECRHGIVGSSAQGLQGYSQDVYWLYSHLEAYVRKNSLPSSFRLLEELISLWL